MKYSNMSNDKRVGFIEEIHKYELVDNPELKFTSVTTFLKQFYEPFDADKIATKYVAKRPELIFDSLPKQIEELSKINLTKAIKDKEKEIKSQWKETGVKASIKGSYIHKLLEDGTKTSINIIDDIIKEINHEFHNDYTNEVEAVKKFYKDYIESGEWTVIETEGLLYDENLVIAGQRDLKVKDKEGRIILADYKTSKKIAKKGWAPNHSPDKTKKMYPPFHDLDDCEWIKYSLQLAMYEYLCPEDTNNVYKKYIIHIKSDGEYELIEALDIKLFFNLVTGKLSGYKINFT